MCPGLCIWSIHLKRAIIFLRHKQESEVKLNLSPLMPSILTDLENGVWTGHWLRDSGYSLHPGLWYQNFWQQMNTVIFVQNPASHLDCLVFHGVGDHCYHVYVDENDNFGSPIIKLTRYLSVVWLKSQHGHNLPACIFFIINAEWE